MPIRSIEEIDIEGRRILIRVDFNVPIHEGRITDRERIEAALPTLKNALNRNAHVILASHLGRPQGKPVPELSLKPVARELSSLLKRPVMMAPGVIGPDVTAMVERVGPSEVLMLENLRFHPGETANDPAFAKAIASYSHVYINDAFGVCHRAHASIDAVPRLFKDKGAGALLQKEIEYLRLKLLQPRRPFVVIFGGAKVDEKIAPILTMLDRATHVIIGGAMAYTFLAAQGYTTGSSLVSDESRIEECRRILAAAEAKGVEILLPTDHLVSRRMQANARAQRIDNIDIPKDLMGLDIGPATVERYVQLIERAQTVIWNGPMGKFEYDAFSGGTVAVARAVANNKQLTIVGGGDTIAALKTAGVKRGISHVSTGGGAMLNFLANKSMPGIEAIEY